MRPDTSDWRNDHSYDFFDTLPIEGLAWECLRRYVPYQDYYGDLLRANTETLPLPYDVQRCWGLRFRGKTEPFRGPATGGVVGIRRSDDYPADKPASLPAANLQYTRRQVYRRA